MEKHRFPNTDSVHHHDMSASTVGYCSVRVGIKGIFKGL